MKTTAVHLITGFEEIEAISIIDVLRRANVNVKIVSMTKEKSVKGSHNVSIESDIMFEDVDYSEIDMIILPGGMPGSTNLLAHNGLVEKIKEFNQNKKYLSAICAAPLVFGQSGILKNKEAVCYPGFEKYLDGAKITDKDVILSENVVTSKGVGTALPFALKLVELLTTKETATNLKNGMLIN